jgi:excisionase family DNA binding protein
MEYYTATQAAQYLHKTEKTVRSWISAGKLLATSVKVRGVSQWQIAQSDLDMLLEQPEVTSNAIPVDTGSTAVQELRTQNEAQGQTIAMMQEQIALLEQRLQALESTATHRPTTTSAIAHKPPVTHTETAGHHADLPDDAMSLDQAGKLLNLSRRQLADILKEQDPEQRYHIATPIAARLGQFHRSMTPEQIEAFRVWRMEQKNC